MFLLILITKASINFLLILPLLLALQLLLKYMNQVTTSVYHKIGTFAFCFLMAGIFIVTGIPSILTIHMDVNISFKLFDGIIPYYEQYVNNVFLFMPFGFLLPLLWKRFNMTKTVFAGFLLSFAIETLQLFCFRCTDINDLWTNTLGAYFGYLLFLVIKKWFPRIVNKFSSNNSVTNKTSFLISHEIYVYIFITWFVIFFIHPFVSDNLMNLILNLNAG